MGHQQTSFDFFNTPPEKPKVSEVPEVLKVGEVLEVSKVEDVLVVGELVDFVVDEEVRDLEFLMPEPVVTVIKNDIKKSTRGRMKLSDMDMLVHLVDVPEDEILFKKRYYGISEVSNMFKVNISLVRFWENEFDILKPKKNGKGDRLFRPEDIKNLQLIYHLLREKKYTIDGAKDFLKKNKKNDETFELIDTLKKTKAFLLDLKANL
ncbi:MAG TPA: MerR family transcriptional regulator [Ferruginibacter sp.]|nr:MerR family transcriptional regulator [Ferruginibacter sp.]